MNRPQYIMALAGVVLVCSLYFFGTTEGDHKKQNKAKQSSAGNITPGLYNEDSMLAEAKAKVSRQQVVRLNELENSVSRGDVASQQLKIYHQLSHFWSDSARLALPYAWYEAKAARLDNSENSLIFAARLFLGNIRQEENPAKKKWVAQQAKELYDRSLSLNPSNDSAQVELGMCYIYGEISETPMEGIQKIRNVLGHDSTNIYAHWALADAAEFSGQYDKAIDRLLQINKLGPKNPDAVLRLADVYASMGKNKEAIEWYTKSLPLLSRDDWKDEVKKRINELK